MGFPERDFYDETWSNSICSKKMMLQLYSFEQALLLRKRWSNILFKVLLDLLQLQINFCINNALFSTKNRNSYKKIKIILPNSTVFRLHVTCETQTFQPDLLRNRGKNLKGECLIMPPTICLNDRKHFKYKMCSDSFKQKFAFCSQKFKQKLNLFFFITVFIILQETRVTFYYNVFKKLLFLKKFPAVYNRIECMSLEVALECLNQMFSK